MSTNDEVARKARAQQIREQIKQMKTSPTNPEAPEEEKPPSRSKSYRDLIHERMHELDKDKKEGS
jgi:hypothetical protein